jgi:hypothetical protein
MVGISVFEHKDAEEESTFVAGEDSGGEANGPV